MVRLGGAMTAHPSRLEPLLVGVAVRQSLSPTARVQVALAGGAGSTAPTWRSAMVGAGTPPHPLGPPEPQSYAGVWRARVS